jgi:hypothetical protein
MPITPTRRRHRSAARLVAALAVPLTVVAAAPLGFANPWNSDCLPDLWVIERIHTDTGRTKVHTLSGDDRYRAFRVHSSTPLRETSSDHSFEFLRGDFNGDGSEDLYVIQKTGTGSGHTEVHVLNGADLFHSCLMAFRPTPLLETGSDSTWVFQLADFNRDRILDLYAIEKLGAASGYTEVHVLNGADRFASFLLHTRTTITETGSDESWVFRVADYSGDGAPDLYAFQRTDTWSGQTEVHILDGASRFRALLVHAAPTTLAESGNDDAWAFSLADLNGDGVRDLYAVQKQDTDSGRTEVHVLNGADMFRSLLVFGAKTPLLETGDDASWLFLAGGCGAGSPPGPQ